MLGSISGDRLGTGALSRGPFAHIHMGGGVQIPPGALFVL